MESQGNSDIIKRTWAQVSRDLEGAGVQLFKEIFASAHGPGKPHTFVPPNSMFDTPKLKEHGVKVMETIGKAVSSVDSPDRLKPVLMSLGKTHAVQYNVQSKQYDMVAAALITTLQKRLGSAWTPSVASAWSELYEEVASAMKSGAEGNNTFVPTKDQKESAANKEKDQGTKDAGSVVQMGTNAVTSAAQEQQSEALHRTWNILKEQGLEEVGVSIFRGIFSAAPSILMLFAFKEELDVYESPGLKSHAVKVMETVGQAVASFDNPAMFASMLRTLGQKHKELSIKDQHYAIFKKSFISALETHLANHWTAEVISAWEGFATEVVSLMQEGETAEMKQAKLVQETWKAVEAQGLQETGVLLFREIFAAAPGALQLFPFKEEIDVYNSVALRAHALGVMETVGTAVGMLDYLPALVPVLKDLGAKHAHFGVKEAHYPVVGQALLNTLEKGLGALWTDDVREAWTNTVTIVAETMKQGVSDERIVSSPPPETPNEAVKRTWKIVAEHALEENGVKLFQAIFSTAPGALQLFSFKDEEDLYNSPSLRGHARGVMETIGKAVEMLDDLPALVPVLKDLGAKHAQRGIKEGHYPVVAKALLTTLENELGDRWTDSVQSAWKSTFELVAATMQEGAAEASHQVEAPTQAVQRTWKAIEQQGLESNGVLLFKEIFSEAPEALELFPFKDELDLYNSSALKAHALLVMETVGKAVEMLDDLVALSPILKELGANHSKYRVKDEHYTIVGRAFIATLERQLGTQWTVEVQAAWVQTFRLLANTMKEGAASVL